MKCDRCFLSNASGMRLLFPMLTCIWMYVRLGLSRAIKQDTVSDEIEFSTTPATSGCSYLLFLLYFCLCL